MPRWPAAGLGHLVRVVMLAYKSVDDTLPVCKARPPPPPRARSSRAAAPPGAGFWWGANGGRALGMRGAAARAAPLGPPVRSRARRGVAEQAGSWGRVLGSACEAKESQGLRKPGTWRNEPCALFTGCTVHRMHCSQDALLTGRAPLRVARARRSGWTARSRGWWSARATPTPRSARWCARPPGSGPRGAAAPAPASLARPAALARSPARAAGCARCSLAHLLRVPGALASPEWGAAGCEPVLCKYHLL
jgi:hypothetical protein